MTTVNCFYLQNRLIQTSQTAGQWYSDTSVLALALPENSRQGFNTVDSNALAYYIVVTITTVRSFVAQVLEIPPAIPTSKFELKYLSLFV
jgi:hypothetical protein